MLKEILFLQTFSYSGGGQFGSFIESLSQMGFFSYILPFLLIFALIYGILLKVKLFEKNAINGIIALAVALLAIQFEAVPIFFSDIFPRLGIGLAIILVVLILVGLFMPNQSWVGYVLFSVSAIIFLVILYQSAGASGSNVLYWIENNLPLLIGLAFVILFVIVVTRSGKPATSVPASINFPLLYPPQKP